MILAVREVRGVKGTEGEREPVSTVTVGGGRISFLNALCSGSEDQRGENFSRFASLFTRTEISASDTMGPYVLSAWYKKWICASHSRDTPPVPPVCTCTLRSERSPKSLVPKWHPNSDLQSLFNSVMTCRCLRRSHPSYSERNALLCRTSTSFKVSAALCNVHIAKRPNPAVRDQPDCPLVLRLLPDSGR